MSEKCCICKSSAFTLRPLGPGRQPICLGCAKSDPERHAIAEMYAKEAQDARALDRLKNAELKVFVIPLSLDDIAADLMARGVDITQPTPGCDCDVCKQKLAQKARATAHVN